MKQIQLETVDDAVSVFNNWHQDTLLIINDLIDKAQDSGIDEYVFKDIWDVIQNSPFKSNHFINLHTMYDNVEIIESIIND